MLKNMRYKAALFDLDGVIVDTESIYTDFWDDIDRRYPTGVDDFARVIKGNTLARILETYFYEDIRDEILVLLKEQEESMRYTLFDGVSDFLDRLIDKNIPKAIVTSSNDRKMSRLFSQIPELRPKFEAVITDALVERSKPDPQGYLIAAEKLGVDPTDCVVFEDSFAGLEAGRRAGAYVVALATTNPRESLYEKADEVIDSFIGYDIL